MKPNNKKVFIGLTALTLVLSASLSWKKEILAELDTLGATIHSMDLSFNQPSLPTEDPVDQPEDPHLKLLQKTFEQGVVMLHAKEYELAITAFHKVLEISPAIPEAYNNLGYALLGLEEYDAAQDFFINATELDENLISAYYGMALTFAHQEKWPIAIGAMETYRHRTTDDDPYLQKAYDYLQEWRELGRNRG